MIDEVAGRLTETQNRTSEDEEPSCLLNLECPETTDIERIPRRAERQSKADSQQVLAVLLARAISFAQNPHVDAPGKEAHDGKDAVQDTIGGIA